MFPVGIPPFVPDAGCIPVGYEIDRRAVGPAPGVVFPVDRPPLQESSFSRLRTSFGWDTFIVRDLLPDIAYAFRYRYMYADRFGDYSSLLLRGILVSLCLFIRFISVCISISISICIFLDIDMLSCHGVLEFFLFMESGGSSVS